MKVAESMEKVGCGGKEVGSRARPRMRTWVSCDLVECRRSERVNVDGRRCVRLLDAALRAGC